MLATSLTVLKAEQPCRGWHLLGKELLKARAACHVTVSSSKGSMDNMLRYLTCVTLTKNKVDERPCRAPGFEVPAKIIRGAKRAKDALTRRPADGEEVKDWVFANAEIHNFRDFTKRVDAEVAASPNSVLFKRLSALASKNRDAKQIVELSVQRRNDQNPDLRTLANFLTAGLGDDCKCAAKDELYNAIVKSLKFHDEREVSKGSSAVIGAFLRTMFTDTFNSRKQTLYMYGVPGSGKSSILNCVLNLVPRERVFTPDFSSAFPFATLRDTHILGNYNEFQVNGKHSPSTWLLLLKALPYKLT